jgi:mono/diheme cytochrome c family protein
VPEVFVRNPKALFSMLLAFGCAFPANAASPNHAAPTFSRDVAPILYGHCVSCHHPGDIAPMSLLTYKDARPWAAAIRESVLTGKMPPWKADPHFGKWSNDPRLSDAEIATLKAWTEGEKLEGNARDLPAAPAFTEGWKIGKPDVILSIPEHKLEGSGPDEYSYVTVPTNFTEDRWVIAAELRPGNRKVVHHAHVFVVDEVAKKASHAPAARTPATIYAESLWDHEGTLEHLSLAAPVINDGCAVDDNGLLPGQKQTDLSDLVSSYLPGRDPDVYPSGTARRIPAGASVKFQIHYSRTTGKTETDTTSVGLIFAKEAPKQVSRRTDVSNEMFLIPPGAADHAVSECHTFDKDILITSLTPHMHLRGKSMRIVADFPNGEKQTLLFVPAYDFNWQFTYRAEKPIFLPRGTRLEVLARFDNSAANSMNPNPKKTLRWGAASEDEMMGGWVEYVDADTGALPQTQASGR